MGSRKRTRSEAIPVAEQDAPEQPELLPKLRSSWEFASLMQYIAIFGQVMKIDEDFGIEDLEAECLKPEPSEKLLEIGLCLLKWISSHRGLTFANFDEYTRRQYNAKAPNKPNPFGYDEEPNKFLEFDVFTKISVLQQLTVWTFWNADRIRDKMPEKKESEQLEWRIEEFGWDREGRSYYVLDDNRLYRRTDRPLPPAPQRPKKKAKSRSSRASRTSKRVSAAAAEEGSDDESKNTNDTNDWTLNSDDLFKWECVAVTLEEYQAFLEPLQKTKDADEKNLRDSIVEHILPILEKAEEALLRKRQKRDKEMLNLQLVAGAKRSSRLAAKDEKERQEREAAEAIRKHEADLAEARKEQARQSQHEEDRQSRMMTREQRIRDREQKRLLHEAELERLAEEQERLNNGESRASARNLKSEMEKSQRNLAELAPDDQWIFDCSGCGVHGENLDDGSHSIACEKCNVWQHSKCLGVSQQAAEEEDFHFVCRECKQKQEQANRPKIPPLKFRVSASASPSAGPVDKKRKLEDDGDLAPPSPVKKSHAALSNVQNEQPRSQFDLQPTVGQGNFYPPPSPQRRAHYADRDTLPSSSPPRPPFSPPKGMNGLLHSTMEQHPRPPSAQHHLPSMQPAPHLPPVGSYQSVRPSSSHSNQSPVQNQPSMSPTQGNPDVGLLAGFPHAAPSQAPSPWGSFETPRPQSGHAATPAMSSGYPSFSAATPNGHHSSPPQSSHGMGMSGISPTKQSPRPPTASGMAGAPVLPPIRRLEPSPKLMGRSSPDAPIIPVKCMTPEQEERRQRENASMLHQAHHYQGNGQHPMSSPSLNRIPPLGSGTTSQYPDPVPSPQRGSNGQN
ncbi:Cat eye syndrome critical region protein [Penicillium brevicompactum]|uniref:Zinc finger PHD-finger n=1 Tax=Penicillium brevicompactum TaxID=5074 RepID=UPI0025410A94|nr:Zinc finger PHD-finger [Penicillium brevicompactum]KAJ5333212.1 Zinc finger PHD-finger [Penicillium brevicompactum]